ncbi:MAG: site-specific integrase [Aquabacterium sp.]|nr:MAG: site-specific integrase [Aquabacterium sp.]
MPRVAKKLGALEVSRLTKPGMHAVGEVPGLYLQVVESGARTWVLRVNVAGKRREMGLGGYPAVTLADARLRAREEREKADKGVDPIEERLAARRALKVAQAAALTFEQAAGKYIEAHEAGWKNAKHGQQWRNTLAQHAYPVMGDTPVREVSLHHVLTTLEPIWRKRTETASRLRGRIELVLDWATARGLREGLNPARWRGHLDKLLPQPGKVAKVTHHPAIPLANITKFMKDLQQVPGTGAKALEFTILTAARSGEVRGATWSEIDLKAAVWTVPAGRMKASREHRVPLSEAAVKLLESLPEGKGDSLVFESPRGGQLSDMTLTAVMRRMKAEGVPHGFRSTFRDWAAEKTNYPREVAEMALAHTIGDKVEAAYRRGDLFEKRRHMMQEWADFLAQPATTAKVVPMKKTKRA